MEQQNWTSMGIAMRSNLEYGESYGHAPDEEMLQAPHVIKENGKHYMFLWGRRLAIRKRTKKGTADLLSYVLWRHHLYQIQRPRWI